MRRCARVTLTDMPSTIDNKLSGVTTLLLYGGVSGHGVGCQMSHSDRQINDQIKAFISEVSDLVAWATVETVSDALGLDPTDTQGRAKRKRKSSKVEPPGPRNPGKKAAGKKVAGRAKASAPRSAKSAKGRSSRNAATQPRAGTETGTQAARSSGASAQGGNPSDKRKAPKETGANANRTKTAAKGTKRAVAQTVNKGRRAAGQTAAKGRAAG